jgi:hypothetical protein
MRLAIIGTGGVGAAVGVKWSQCGHAVTYGSRDPDQPRLRALLEQCGTSARVAAPRQAAADAEAILLAVPWPVARQTLEQLGSLAGRTLIDCTNPLLGDLSGIEVGHLTSAAEQIAEWAPGAHVVKAFNTASVKVMRDPQFGAYRATMFYCGDSGPAKATVHRLIEDVGFEAVDAGGLVCARYLEPLAMLYIQLAVRQGWGSNCAFKMMKR